MPPADLGGYDRILLGHGSGGTLSNDLIRKLFVPGFGNSTLAALEDQATLSVGSSRIALTTDSFVVKPIFFPGGDIGSLAIHGTVNDLAVGGATPLFLSAAFILEEEALLADRRIETRASSSMRTALCDEASGVTLVTGDTKVVDRGKGDQIFITTAGIGIVPQGRVRCRFATPNPAI